jgi:DNA-binding GntR family transcriptional regulator
MDGASAGSAADSAYRALRDAIIEGSLATNTRLTEVAVADDLGLSRTPVREAIKRLIMEGFLTRIPGEGLRVAGLDLDEIDQIFQIRLMLECYAARRAATLATAKEIAELRELASTMSARTPPRDATDMQVLTEANASFHRLILRAAKSPRLTTMLTAAVNLGLVLRTYRMYSERDIERSSRHHHEIADAIEARAPEWAASVMASHLQAAAAVAKQDGARQSGGEGRHQERPAHG